MLLIRARNLERDRIRARREQQPIEVAGLAILDRHLLPGHVHGLHARAGEQLDVVSRVEGSRVEWQPTLLGRAREIILRKIRAIVRRCGIGAEHRDRAGESAAPRASRRPRCRPRLRRRSPRASRRTTESQRVRPRSGVAPSVCLDLARHDHRVAAALHRPARHGTQCRRAERLSGAQAEARVMPWTANGLAHDQPLAERTAVVRARGADCEDLVPRRESSTACPCACPTIIPPSGMVDAARRPRGRVPVVVVRRSWVTLSHVG